MNSMLGAGRRIRNAPTGATGYSLFIINRQSTHQIYNLAVARLEQDAVFTSGSISGNGDFKTDRRIRGVERCFADTVRVDADEWRCR